jgi:hypothetical protein
VDPSSYSNFLSLLTQTKTSLNSLILDTIVGKVGVTTENNSHWESRKNTFSPCPNSTKFECINVPFNQKNAKIIESLAFARLTSLGLKVDNRKTKSAQGEFFKLFVEINNDDNGATTVFSTQKDIEKGMNTYFCCNIILTCTISISTVCRYFVG